MKSTELLIAQHREVAVLLDKVLKSQGIRQRDENMAELRLALELHMAIEEEIFYPAYREAVATKRGDRLVLEACEAHHVVKLVLADTRNLDVDDAAFTAKMTVLKELVEHHMKMEEEEMFPDAMRILGDK